MPHSNLLTHHSTTLTAPSSHFNSHMKAKLRGHPGGCSVCVQAPVKKSQSKIRSSELIGCVGADWPCECVGLQCELCVTMSSMFAVWWTREPVGNVGHDFGREEDKLCPCVSQWMLWMCTAVNQQPSVRGMQNQQERVLAQCLCCHVCPVGRQPIKLLFNL